MSQIIEVPSFPPAIGGGKRYYQLIWPTTREALEKAINSTFDWVSSSDILGWFEHCGYMTTKS
ncbi:MAG: hypothetical protein LBR79_05140 [Oscillospiraceae bacterium]|jgi:hypothetical protein|nr:hypothetical protein [Oscillospiraceae bacterium]